MQYSIYSKYFFFYFSFESILICKSILNNICFICKVKGYFKIKENKWMLFFLTLIPIFYNIPRKSFGLSVTKNLKKAFDLSVRLPRSNSRMHGSSYKWYTLSRTNIKVCFDLYMENVGFIVHLHGSSKEFHYFSLYGEKSFAELRYFKCIVSNINNWVSL